MKETLENRENEDEGKKIAASIKTSTLYLLFL